MDPLARVPGAWPRHVAEAPVCSRCRGTGIGFSGAFPCYHCQPAPAPKPPPNRAKLAGALSLCAEADLRGGLSLIDEGA